MTDCRGPEGASLLARRDVQQWQKECWECPGKGESLPHGASPTSYPWEILAVNFLSLGRPGEP